MTAYRRKPKPLENIEALLFTGTNCQEVAEFTGTQIPADLHLYRMVWAFLAVGGVVWLRAGDWVIKRTDGKLRTCSATKFAKHYEPVALVGCWACGHPDEDHGPRCNVEFCACSTYRVGRPILPPVAIRVFAADGSSTLEPRND